MGGTGGGSIRINAQSLTIYGIISANGLPGLQDNISLTGSGGGSGGTISITAQKLLFSNASISANGGNGSLGGGGGGGGCIYISSNDNHSVINGSETITATGGTTSCSFNAQNGTVVYACLPGIVLSLYPFILLNETRLRFFRI